MAIYKITDVLDSIQSMKKDGYEYIDISELTNDDDDDDATLVIDAIEDISSTVEDMIDSVSLPENYSCHQW